MTELTVTARAGREYADVLRERLEQCLAVLRDTGESLLRELSVALVGDKIMSDLHGTYHGDATPTDVLTFELEHDADGRCAGGEVVVCVSQARRKSRSRGTSLPDELLLYALHGTLHLCGYDDRADEDFRLMHQREDELLTAIGIGPVFAEGAA